MDKKTFIISGLVIIHFYFLLGAITQYFGISRVFSGEAMSSVGNILLPATLLSFGALLFLRFKTIGRKKRDLIWCALFYIITAVIGGVLAWVYMVAADAVTDAHWEHIRVISRGQDATLGMYMKFVLYLVPVSYLINWGLFALLWFGSRDPKASGHSNSHIRNKPTNPRVGSYVRNMGLPA